jgi:hypothetical protein
MDVDMSAVRLAPAEIERSMQNLPDWAVEGDRLHRLIVFRNFVDAFGFMSKVALLAERMVAIVDLALEESPTNVRGLIDELVEMQRTYLEPILD